MYLLDRYEHVGVMWLVTRHGNFGFYVGRLCTFRSYLADSVDVSKEPSASSRLMMYETYFHFTYQTAWCQIPEDRKLSTNHSDNYNRWEESLTCSLTYLLTYLLVTSSLARSEEVTGGWQELRSELHDLSLPWLMFCMVFLCPSSERSGIVPIMTSRSLPSGSFPCSLLTILVCNKL
jgi:hypothetical protein